MQRRHTLAPIQQPRPWLLRLWTSTRWSRGAAAGHWLLALLGGHSALAAGPGAAAAADGSSRAIQ
eukprot:1415150-Rhodomonas_salina.1